MTKRPTLEEWFNARLKAYGALHEPVTIETLKHAHQLVLDQRGPKYAKLCLQMFGVKTIEDLNELRYGAFLDVCKKTAFKPT